MTHQRKNARREEELLEAIWSAREKGSRSLSFIGTLAHVPVEESLLSGWSPRAARPIRG